LARSNGAIAKTCIFVGSECSMQPIRALVTGPPWQADWLKVNICPPNEGITSKERDAEESIETSNKVTFSRENGRYDPAYALQ